MTTRSVEPEPTVAPATGATLVGRLEAVIARGAARPALRAGGSTWSYGRLWERAGAIASDLLARHDQAPGARIGVLGENDPDYLAAYLGILRGGCVPVPLNPLLRAEEIAAQLELVGASACLTGTVAPSAATTIAARLAVVPIAELGVRDGVTAVLPPIGPSDDATILLTSGTTGTPKGSVQTHATMLHAVDQLHRSLPYSPSDVMLAFLPFFAAIPEQVWPTLLAGGCLEILPRFDVAAVDEACERATTLDAVPTLMARLIDGVPARRLARLRWLLFASEPMPPALLARWWDALPTVRTYEFYGMTELLTISVAAPELLRAAPTSVGRPFPSSRVAIVDGEGRPLAPGEAGEVVCASPARMRGYLPDGIDPTTWRLPDGSMRTGDLGRFDDEGRLHLTGRIKDLIISGGLNIAPAEIEAVAAQHDAVATAVVVGIPDARWGETPVLVALAKPGRTADPRELLAFCRGRLASFKRPRFAVVVDELPQTGIGKSSKAAIRERIMRGDLELTGEA